MYNNRERIKKILAIKSVTLHDFCKKIGLNSTTTIAKIISENRKPSSKTIGRILKAYPDINYDWLISGEGNIIGETEKELKKAEQKELTKSAKQVIDYIDKNLLEKIAIVLEDMKEPLKKIEKIEKDLEAIRVYMAAKFEIGHKEKINKPLKD